VLKVIRLLSARRPA